MASKLTPLGVACKWIVIPIALGVIGYFLVGPRIGVGVLDRVKMPDRVRSMLGSEEKPKGPSVEVDRRPNR